MASDNLISVRSCPKIDDTLPAVARTYSVPSGTGREMEVSLSTDILSLTGQGSHVSRPVSGRNVGRIDSCNPGHSSRQGLIFNFGIACKTAR
ncbi:MAG: hypothetical protein LBJ72_04370 [Dysgonamonadaceae bacterium]|nr:hypothetical protein [Dysgonamonadaceae bacterium]